MENKITDEGIVNTIWHSKIEDNMSWEFCSGILRQEGYKISSKVVEKKFYKYFKKEMGVEPYKECPLCGETLTPRVSKYGYFIGCSAFPKCNFIATNTKPYKIQLEQRDE